MSVVDAHCHVSPYWYEPVEALLDQMDRSDVRHAVLTCTNFQTSLAYEQRCAAEHPDRFSFIGNLKSATGTPQNVVADIVAQGATGLRVKLRGEHPDADLTAVFAAAADHDLTVSLLGTSAQYNAAGFHALFTQIPGLRVVIEHLGTSSDAEDETDDDRRRVFDLAEYDGVNMKFHGLGDFAPRKSDPFDPFPFEEPVPPYLTWAYEAFGSSRLMWGSNFPEVSRHEGYANALRLARQHLTAATPDELDAMFGANALRLLTKS